MWQTPLASVLQYTTAKATPPHIDVGTNISRRKHYVDNGHRAVNRKGNSSGDSCITASDTCRLTHFSQWYITLKSLFINITFSLCLGAQQNYDDYILHAPIRQFVTDPPFNIQCHFTLVALIPRYDLSFFIHGYISTIFRTIVVFVSVNAVLTWEWGGNGAACWLIKNNRHTHVQHAYTKKVVWACNSTFYKWYGIHVTTTLFTVIYLFNVIFRHKVSYQTVISSYLSRNKKIYISHLSYREDWN